VLIWRQFVDERVVEVQDLLLRASKQNKNLLHFVSFAEQIWLNRLFTVAVVVVQTRPCRFSSAIKSKYFLVELELMS
jgi:hypothetical protein